MTATDAKRSDSSWTLLDLLEQAPGFLTLSETLSALVDEGVPLVALTGDLKYSNGLVRFAERHPERFFNMGISEQNMLSAAAGMATTGLMPFVAEFASFLALLCCEQIRTDVAYSKLPVRLIGHHSGISFGFYGTSHHATEDLAIMRSIAGLTVIAPSDPGMLAAVIRASIEHERPMYIRIGRGREPQVYSGSQLDAFEIGRAIWHGHGEQATLIATGTMVSPAIEAVTSLRAAGHSVGLIDMHTIKPFDSEAVLEAAGESRRLITVEEHNVIGGLGGTVAELLADAGAGVPLHRHGIKDEYSLIGPPTRLYEHYRLDGAGITNVVNALLASDADNTSAL